MNDPKQQEALKRWNEKGHFCPLIKDNCNLRCVLLKYNKDFALYECQFEQALWNLENIK